MGSSERLQNEILLKEEAFLKEQRAKLTEQLNKLKVRMLALSRSIVNFIKLGFKSSVCALLFPRK